MNTIHNFKISRHCVIDIHILLCKRALFFGIYHLIDHVPLGARSNSAVISDVVDFAGSECSLN